MAYEESHTIISIDTEMAFINVQCLFSHDKNSKNFILNLIRSVLPDPQSSILYTHARYILFKIRNQSRMPVQALLFKTVLKTVVEKWAHYIGKIKLNP